MQIHAPTALLADGWHDAVLIEITDEGRIGALRRGVPPPAGAEQLAGPLLPGMPNLHSHAFQRALAGLAERRTGADFWGWRALMYRFLEHLGPEELEAIAAWLYCEMLEAGYTAVGEFHYLHHDPAGRRYADPAEMSLRLLAAAGTAGIAITLLPALYAHGDFGGAPPEGAQRRFVHDAEGFAALLERLDRDLAGAGEARLGLALHSLRAVDPALAREGLAAARALDPAMPVHVHAAEQPREVEACLAWCGRRPVEWLLEELGVDPRWCLVHATHIEPHERERLAASGAVAGLCPSTEANLGDGLFPAAAYLAAGGRFGIGSDSQVSVSPIEELRLLEYGQRLVRGERAVLASPECPSPGRCLWEGAARGGACALGLEGGAIAPGCRADLLVLDPDSALLAARRDDALLDTLVFSGNAGAVHEVMVGGRWRVRGGRHPERERLLAGYRAACAALGERVG